MSQTSASHASQAKSAIEAQIARLADRTRVLRAGPPRAAGEFVLCWLATSLRADENPVFERSLAAAHKLGKPLVVYRGLSLRYPHASDRIHRFILEGEPELRAAIEARGASYRFFLQQSLGDRERWADRLAARASVVFVDDFPTPEVSRGVASFTERASCPVLAVDSACVVPMRVVGKAYERAIAFRKAVKEEWEARTLPIPALPPPVALPGRIDLEVPDTAIQLEELGEFIARLPIDHTVPPAPDRRGGMAAAKKRWHLFRDRSLDSYKRHRDDALRDEAPSGLSPYLHFGMIWAGRIAREAGERRSESANKFIDDLLVGREMAWNFCFHRPNHGGLGGVPPWAQKSLAERAPPARTPSARQLDLGQTEDKLWDAAQQRLRRDGWLHESVRMTWGKQIVAWTHDPALALARLTDLHDRYALDGRDPASHGALLWCLGQFDPPQKATKEMGLVRARPTQEQAKKLPPGNYGAPARAAHPAQRQVIIVGAGMCGFACARTLVDAGMKVTLVDKASSVGGRVAAQKPGIAPPNEGPIEARTASFRRLLDQLAEDGSAVLLPPEAAGSAIDQLSRNGHPSRYTFPAGIEVLTKELSRGLSLRTGARVSSILPAKNGHAIRFEDGSTIEGTDLVLTLPGPQSAELLATGDAEAVALAGQLAAHATARLPGPYLSAAQGSLLVTGSALGKGSVEEAFLKGTAVASSLLGRHLGHEEPKRPEKSGPPAARRAGPPSPWGARGAGAQGRGRGRP